MEYSKITIETLVSDILISKKWLGTNPIHVLELECNSRV